MDDYGIGNSIRGAVQILVTGGRGSGKTTRMLERYQEGDRIIVTTEQEGRRLTNIGKQMGKNVVYSVVKAENPGDIFNSPTPQGRTLFDHSWVERFYFLALENAYEDLKRLQDESSGRGVKHRETAEAAKQRARFHSYL